MLRKVLKEERFLFIAGISLLYLLLLLVGVLVHVLRPQRTMPLAITEIFEPYFFLPLLLFVPFAFVRKTWVLRIILIASFLLFSLRYMPHFFVGPTETSQKQTLKVLTWNTLVGNKRDAYAINLLLAKDADVLALQEADWQVVSNDQELLARYPHYLFSPDLNVPPGIIILSKYPIKEYGILAAQDGSREIWDIPRVLWVRLDMGAGHTAIVVNAHPISAANTVPGCLLCSEMRDDQIREISTFAQKLIRDGETVMLVGDMNVTDREPAYRDLSRGLQDTHILKGVGSGHSWGIRQFNPYWALLRIDYIFTSPNIKPLEFKTDCSSRGSDHCVLQGTFALPW